MFFFKQLFDKDTDPLAFPSCDRVQEWGSGAQVWRHRYMGSVEEDQPSHLHLEKMLLMN